MKNRNENIILLKKINILKALLLEDNVDINNLKITIDKLFNTEKDETINNLKIEIQKNDFINCLNILNNYKEIINKNIFKNPCEKKWEELIDTEDNYTKFCSDCSKNVFLVSNETDYLKRKNLEQCIAFNSFEFNPNEEINKNYKSCHIKFVDEYELGLPW